MKVLIIGADGQLGFDLMRVFGDKAIGLTHKDIEVKDRDMVIKKINEIKPDAVINTAAIVKSEWCELNKDECFAVNASGASNVAEAAALVRAVSVQISTDYVFDGSKESFSENDQPNPLNVYGASKLEGERLVQQKNPKHYIVRSGWFFGKHIPHKGLDFPRMMLKLAKEKSEVRVVDDQFGSPTYTKDLAYKIKEVLEKPAPFGIYHITNQGRVSWYELAKKIFELSGVVTPLLPISTADSQSKIKRPTRSALTNSALPLAGIALLQSWEDALLEYQKEIR